MKLQRYLAMGLMLLISATPAFAVDAVQDPDISVTPVVIQFPITTLGTSSTPALFTITNHSASALSLGTLSLSGVNPTEFTLGTTDCSASLGALASCTVAVSFSPSSGTAGKGTKSAALLIPYGSGKSLTAFLTNGTSPAVEAQRRMPAVLADVSIPETMTGGIAYPLTWTLEGYDDAYTSIAVLFDCTGAAAGTCGNTYSDTTKFAESAPFTQTVGTRGKVSYSGVVTKQFAFSWSYTIPANRTWAGGAPWGASPGTNIVVRFYQISDVDAARNNTNVSLLIPGNQAARYYDTAGRRILKSVVAP